MPKDRPDSQKPSHEADSVSEIVTAQDKPRHRDDIEGVLIDFARILADFERRRFQPDLAPSSEPKVCSMTGLTSSRGQAFRLKEADGEGAIVKKMTRPTGGDR